MAVSRKDVLTYLEESNMVEISELISEIEEKFGVSAAAPVAVAAASSAGSACPGTSAPSSQSPARNPENMKMLKLTKSTRLCHNPE